MPDTYYVGKHQRVGRIYQQTFIDSYSKTVMVKLYDRKMPSLPPTCFNDRVLPGKMKKTVFHCSGY